MRTRPYQRRRRGPVIAFLTVLAVLAIATWTTVVVNASGPAGLASCSLPPAGPPPGMVQPGDSLDVAAPRPPAEVRVRVLNGGGQRGQAALVAAQLTDLGFAQSAPPESDPFHPDGEMECVGQIRFGPTGETAAATVALVLPCAEAVRDDRADDTVDVAIGTGFGDLNPGRAARDALTQLTESAAAPVDDGADSADSGTDGGADGTESTAPPPTAAADPAVLDAARSISC